MKLRLVKASNEYKKQITEMMDEWSASGEKIIPYTIRRNDYHDFDYYCSHLEVKDTSEGLVPDSTFFCLDEDRDLIVGAVNIRHYLNDVLLLNGGHIGDGVRPSERGKGIATRMIGLALQECRTLGINRVLMVCDKQNAASAKSIMNNGGILENEIEVDGVIEQRYWITLGSGISIRHVEASDKSFWYRLDKHLPEAEFDLKVCTGRGYVLSLDAEPIGLLRYNLFWDNTPFCTMIYVDDKYQGAGYGRALMEYWEEDMKRQGYGMLLTSTQVDEEAQHFYRKLGYKDCGALVIDIPAYAQPMEMFLSKGI